MRWPWVNRAVVEELLAAAKKQSSQLGGMATAIALRDQEISGLNGTINTMAEHCRELERKQRDLDAPQISAEGLERLHKLHAFRIRQVETLEAHNAKLEAEIKSLRIGEPRPSPVALVRESGQ